MYSIFAQNFSFIDEDDKELSLSKKIETLNTWISFNTYPNDLKFLSHIKSFMIYKIPNLHIQKNTQKGDMTKTLDLTQNLQNLITLTKQILFFWNFENRGVF
jgi:hypothetical protein